ncbi:MAG TPA: 2-dehydropantoate 2-reductase [Candidatus Dormibacteraeota bacterium]
MSQGSYAVLGAGGIGGLIAGALAHGGHSMTLIVRPGAEQPARLQVDSDVLGSFEEEVAVVTELSQPVDILWVTVKAGQLEAALRQVARDRVREAVIPLLNGLDHMEVLRRHFGDELVATGTIAVESERVAPGRIRQLGGFINVVLAGPRQEVVEGVALDLKSAGISARATEDGRKALWAKLIILAAISLSTTAAQAPLGRLRGDPEWRPLILGTMSEIRRVAAAEGVELEEPVAALDALPDPMRSSMQKDAAAGRPLELDHIAGPVLRRGREHGVATPATEELARRIRERYPDLT